MNLVRHDPWYFLNEMRDQLNKAYGGAGEGDSNDHSSVVTSQWRPAVDIKEEDTRFVLVADIPGVEPKDVEITMEDGVLSVKGERETEKKETGEGYSRSERVRGKFYRRFSLPDTADPDGIEAHGEHGVVTVLIPKKPVAQPRRIEVVS